MLNVLVLWLTLCECVFVCVCFFFVFFFFFPFACIQTLDKSLWYETRNQEWKRKHADGKKCGKSTIEWKISRLLFGKQENKRKCVNKVFNENAGFFLLPRSFFFSFLLHMYVHIGICVCVFYSVWPNQSRCPIGILCHHTHSPPMPPWFVVFHCSMRCINFISFQFISLVNQMQEHMCCRALCTRSCLRIRSVDEST